MASRTAPTKFAAWLEEQLAERGMSVRALSRAINGDNPELARRALYTYLSEGRRPGRAMRRSLADALGVPVGQLPSGDDEELGQ